MVITEIVNGYPIDREIEDIPVEVIDSEPTSEERLEALEQAMLEMILGGADND